MNTFNKFFLSVAAMLLLIGCSDDVANQQTTNPIEEETPSGVYMGVSFQMPGMGQTRSYTEGDNTSSSGVEVGTDIENNVNEVYLVLARKKDLGLIGSAYIMRDNIYKHLDTNNAVAYHAATQFNTTALDLYYNDPDFKDADGNTETEVAVFVIVNPTGGIIDLLNETHYGNLEWYRAAYDQIEGTMGESSIWSAAGGGSFLMTNTVMAYRQIPPTMSAWDKYTEEEHPFSLSELNAADNINNAKENLRGPVMVHRAAVRLDFKDGSELGDRKYNVLILKYLTGEIQDKWPIVGVQLNKMCLVNMSNKFYYFQRVSDNGLNGTLGNRPAGWELCGPEKPWFTNQNGQLVENMKGNYVVDCFADEKEAGIESNFSQYFNYPFFDNEGLLNVGSIDSDSRWAIYQMEDVLKGTQKDNWNNKSDYVVWRYITENTIPGVEEQVNGISTGIVFKAKMYANDALKAELDNLNDTQVAKFDRENLKQVIDAINNTEPETNDDGDPLDSWKSKFLYYYAGFIYCEWENLYQAAIYSSFSYTVAANGAIIPDWDRTSSLYRAVFGNGGTGYSVTVGNQTYTDPLDLDPEAANSKYIRWSGAQRPSTSNPDPDRAQIAAQFKEAVTKANITIYQRSNDNRDGWGYYCYYYYWNRHNDNGRNGIMGPMEFATVRNNVYKLSVSKIAKLGHPRRSDNDPDNPTPLTPDESSQVYLTVDTEAVPWVVRVNNIEF